MDTKHVVSLELARQMREAGFPQVSAFYHWEYKDENLKKYCLARREIRIIPKLNVRLISLDNPKYFTTFGHKAEEYCSAYLASELGGWLPIGYFSILVNTKWNGYKKGLEWCCMNGEESEDEYADTECDARAKMLLCLAKEGMINPKELKV